MVPHRIGPGRDKAADGQRSDNPPVRPFPSIARTCRAYLDRLRPLMIPDDFQKTAAIVKNFESAGGEGERLQNELERCVGADPAIFRLLPYAEDWYLTLRDPLPININPFYVLEPNRYRQGGSQVQRAAALVVSALRFKEKIDRGELEPDIVKGVPLCMHQYRRLFSSCRVPEHSRDRYRSPVADTDPTASGETHICVFCRNRIYKLEAYSSDGRLRTMDAVARDLAVITRKAAVGDPTEPPIGFLTTMDREAWAAARKALIRADEQNRVNLDAIERALFVLCLDDACPENLVSAARMAFHGSGGNRWFDKLLQVIVGANAEAGLCYEHSHIDGSVMIRLVRFLHEDNIGDRDGSASEALPPEELCFRLNPELAAIVRKARDEFCGEIRKIHVQTVLFERFGQNRIKTFGISPDAFVQLALQLAQYRLWKKFCTIGESVLMRKFLHGRTEVFQTASLASQAFVLSMAQRDIPAAGKIDYLLQAARIHSERISECMDGYGVEGHLSALLAVYGKRGMKLGITAPPALFRDVGWSTLTRAVFSTSTTRSVGVKIVGFGPVVDNGFGIRYGREADHLVFCLTSRTDMAADLDRFSTILQQALVDMAGLLDPQEA